MISRRVAALVAGIALAIGLVLGASGTIAASDPATPAPAAYGCGDYMGDLPGVMGSGTSGMGTGMMGAGSSAMYDLMRQHHGGFVPPATP